MSFPQTEGRVNRLGFFDKSYGSALILLMIFWAALAFISNELWSLGAMLVLSLIYFVHTIGVAIRRLHDLGKSGWLVLLYMVPLVQIFFLVYLMAWPGDPEKNEYGEPDRERSLPGVIVALVLSLGFAAGTSYYAISNIEQTQKSLIVKVQKVEKLKNDITGSKSKALEESVRAIPLPKSVEKKQKSAERSTAQINNAMASMSQTGKWTAEDFFLKERENLQIVISSELARFRRLCGRLPSATQERLFVLNLGKRAKLCPKWTGRIPRMSPENFSFPVYLSKVSDRHMTIYTYGADNQAGGDGPNRDWRLDIKNIE
jgi:uncharacterized membrane protein YhaH (DUF805 family)